MCRLLCVASLKPNSIKQYLAETPYSLTKQAAKGKHRHGWGVGYYEQETPLLVKSCKTICDDVTTTKPLYTKLFIAHVRKATNPRKLPLSTLISEVNTHPFTYKNYTFAHNGTLKIPDAVEKQLGEYAQHLQGQCDSEILFYFILKLIEEHGNVITALTHLDEELWKIARSIKSEKPYNSINFILSDGKNIYAYNRYNTTRKKTAHFSNMPYFEMVYNITDDAIIIASEPIHEGPWKTIGNNTILHATITPEYIHTKLYSLKNASDVPTPSGAAVHTPQPY